MAQWHLAAAIWMAGLGPAATALAQDGAAAEEDVVVVEVERDQQALLRAILERMHLVNQMVMQAGLLAMEKGTTDNVRDYGERLFRDHREAAERLRALATERDVRLPADLGPDQMRAFPELAPLALILAKLRAVDGEAFDRVFIAAMEQVHRNALTVLVERVPALEDEALEEEIVPLLPILGQHLELARNLAPGPPEPR